MDGRVMIMMPTLRVTLDGLYGHDDHDDQDNGEGRHTEETPWALYSRRFLEVAFCRIWVARFGRGSSLTTTEEEGTMTGSVMEKTEVVGVTGESSSSSFSDPQKSLRCMVIVDVSRGAIDVTTIDRQMTMTRDAAVVTGLKTFWELCEGVHREMRPCRRRPRPPTPIEDEARVVVVVVVVFR
jgi:hypothetical protein